MKKGLVLFLAMLLIIGVTPVSAQEEEHFRVPFYGYHQLCTGEEVYFEGEALFVYHQRFDQTGRMHLLLHTSIKASGIGLTTGTVYQVSSFNKFSSQVAVTGDQWTNTTNGHSRWIGAGSGPVETWRLVYKITVNANGELTATVDQNNFACD